MNLIPIVSSILCIISPLNKVAVAIVVLWTSISSR